MTRKSDTLALAQWFREQVQGQPFYFNDPTCKMLLKQAKNLVNPGPEGRAYALGDVKEAVQHAVREIRKRDPNFTPNNIQVLTWTAKSGKTYFDEAITIPPPPPIYERIALLEWLDKYGDKALGPKRASELKGQHDGKG